MAIVSPKRLRADLVALAHRDRGVREFSLGAARILRRAVPFDGVCVLTLDPATLLPTGEVVENGLPSSATARLTEIEIGETDFNKFDALARAKSGTASLSAATDGDLDRSVRHRELRGPGGFGDELRAVLVTGSAAWGALTLLRERGRADFTPAELRLVESLSGQLAQGLRRAVVRGVSAPGPGPEGSTGVVVLEPDDSPALASPDGEAWLAELLEDRPPGERVPHVVTAVAGRARGAAAGDAGPGARARVRTPSGRWVLIHGSALGDEPGGRVAVIIEPAGAPELAPLIADAYGLTGRERAITQLVAQGFGTDAIAKRLLLSPWTVQDHLKAVFEKTGTGTRGELVARLFFEHYAPRL
jgi:DNA-binding CsgD family transcriptional regulator